MEVCRQFSGRWGIFLKTQGGVFIQQIRVKSIGDSALSVIFGSDIKEEMLNRIISLKRLMEAECGSGRLRGVRELLPTYGALNVFYDPQFITWRELEEQITGLLERITNVVKYRLIRIPVCYGGDLGPDLAAAASLAAMTKEEFVTIHSETDYLIYMPGGQPGQAHLSHLNPRLVFKEPDRPDADLLEGSIWIAGRQTGISTACFSGPQFRIGMTPIQPYNIRRRPAVLYEAGDRIRFIPVSADEYEQIRADWRVGIYQCRITEEEGCVDGN